MNATRVNVLAHSMGNRLFEEQIIPKLPSSEQQIDNYISIGADLEANIFEKNQPLEHIASLCKNILVYNHNNDRTLGISRAINKTDRLGLNGISPEVLADSSFYQIDVSQISDLQILKDISNHRYYYTSDQVKTDIKDYLLGVQYAQRVHLSADNHYKILPEKK